MMGRKQKWRQAGPFKEGKQWEQVHGAGMRFCGGAGRPIARESGVRGGRSGRGG